MSGHVYIVAAERSGDDLGAQLARLLKAEKPDLTITGIGGTAMAEQGIDSPIDIAPLSILGFVEGLKSYPTIMRLVRAAVDDIITAGPDMVVLIDSWGFMMRVAERLKKHGYAGKIVKYVAPQVWAMREGRTKVLARSVDHLLTIHSFDAPYFEREGLPVTYVGNPVFDTDYAQGNGAALRARYNIEDDAPVIAVLFGSRPSEIARLAGPFADAIEILRAKFPRAIFMSPVASSVATQVGAQAATDMRLQDVILLGEYDKYDVFAASTAALACSGTVTTQTACAGIPAVIGYKLSGLTWAIASRLYKPDHVSIVNIAAGERLMPECIQGDCTGEKLAAELSVYIEDPAARAAASEALLAQTKKMRGTGGHSGSRACDAILNLLTA